MKASALLATIALAASLCIGQASDVAVVANSTDLSAFSDLSLLGEAFQRAGLQEAIAALPEATILAPTNEALVALLPFLSEVTGQEVTGWNDIPMDVLTQVLLYHVLPKPMLSADFDNAMVIDTLLPNSTLTVAVEDGVTTFIPSSGFFPANITTADLEFNGPSWIVQIISEVLIPTAALA